MIRRWLFSLLLLAGLLLALAVSVAGQSAAPAADPGWPDIALVEIASGFDHPVHITHAGDDSGRLFVVEQTGRIRILQAGDLLPAPFLDITGRVGCCSERGLLSVAFPPDFGTKQHFYVNYTDKNGDTVISRLQVSAADPNRADPDSEEILLTIPQPYANHNGGQLAFSPRDGYLYIGMGDGGSGGDPLNNGQHTDILLGKMLRIDVESGKAPYGIPASNPFTQTTGYLDEIWALGLRNPWRFSFDRLNGDLYIGDVGQNQYEEIDYQAAGSAGGENYGWRIMEGFHCHNASTCDQEELTLPVLEYDHSLGCSVTGGHIYRGAENVRMRGVYFYGDYCQGRIWGLRQKDGSWESTQLHRASLLISSFGESEAGNLYVVDYRSGSIFEIVDQFVVNGRYWLPMVLRS